MHHLNGEHRIARASLLAMCAVILAAGSASATPSAVPRAAPTTTLVCKDAISRDSTVFKGFSVVLGRAGLPTGYAFGASQFRDPHSNRDWFAKQGLLIKADTTFEVIVPAAWTSRLRISWGKPGKETTRLRVPRCHSTKAGKKWLGFAGGYTLTKPACIPLIVKTATAQRTVHIGAGKACPGQSPAPNPVSRL